MSVEKAHIKDMRGRSKGERTRCTRSQRIDIYKRELSRILAFVRLTELLFPLFGGDRLSRCRRRAAGCAVRCVPCCGVRQSAPCCSNKSPIFRVAGLLYERDAAALHKGRREGAAGRR